MMKIASNKSTKVLLMCVGLSLALSACTTHSESINVPKVKKIFMTDKIELTDTYQLFEKEGDLYFVLTLKNNTSKTIEVSSTIQPFNIYRQNYKTVEERYVLSSPGPFKEIIK